MGEEGDDMETGKMFDWDQSMAQGFTQVSINLRRKAEHPNLLWVAPGNQLMIRIMSTIISLEMLI